MGVLFVSGPDHVLFLCKGPADTVSGLVGGVRYFALKERSFEEWMQLLQSYHTDLPSQWLPSIAEQLRVSPLMLSSVR